MITLCLSSSLGSGSSKILIFLLSCFFLLQNLSPVIYCLSRTVFIDPSSPTSSSALNFPCSSTSQPCNSLKYVLQNWNALFPQATNSSSNLLSLTSKQGNSATINTEELNIYLLNNIVSDDISNCAMDAPYWNRTSTDDSTSVILNIYGQSSKPVEISCDGTYFIQFSPYKQQVNFDNVNIIDRDDFLVSPIFIVFPDDSTLGGTIARSQLKFNRANLVNVDRLFDIYSFSYQPEVYMSNSKVYNSRIECSYSCSFNNIDFVRNMTTTDQLDIFDVELTQHCIASFNSSSFMLYTPFIEKTLKVDNYVTQTKCTSSADRHFFIHAPSSASLQISNSKFSTDCRGEQCGGLAQVNCLSCAEITISNTVFNASGNIILKAEPTYGSPFLILENIDVVHSTCHYVSIQSFTQVRIGNSKFSDNYNMGSWPILAISDTHESYIYGSQFLDNDGGGLFLQNVRNGTIIECKFESTSGASALRYLDLQQYSETATDTLKVISSTFSNNDAQFGAAINSNTLKFSVIGCVFTGNTALRHGGSIYVSDQSERVTDRVFSLKSSQFYDGKNTAASSFGGFIYITSESGQVYIEGTTFKRGFSQDSGGCLYLDIPFSTLTSSSLSQCSSRYDGGALFIEKGTTYLNESSFSSNECDGYGGSLYLKSSTSSYIYRSEFKSSISRQGRAGGIYGERKSSISIYYSLFENNNSTIRGAAVYISRGDLLDISHSTFQYNNIIYNPAEPYSEQGPAGGSVFAYGLGTLNIKHSTFYKNKVEENRVKEGMGGAILITPSSSSTVLNNITFDDNKADNGGAMYIYNMEYPNSKFSLSDISFLHNRATNSGGALFLVGTLSMKIVEQSKQSYFYDNYAELYGDNYASDPKIFALSNNGWKPRAPAYDFPLVLFEGLFTHNSTGLTLYPGQQLSITLDAFDLFNERMESIKNADIDLIVTDNLNDIRKETHKFFATTFSNDTAVFTNVQISGRLNQTLYLYFNCKNVIEQFYLQIQMKENCPFSFDYGNNECVFNAAVQNALLISLGIVVALGLTFIFLLTGICLYFFKKKVKELKKREQAEEDLHKRLLQYQLISSKHSIHDDTAPGSSYSQDKSWIIKPEDLEIVERIGQGGESVIFKAKWMNNTVAVKRINLDLTAHDEDDIQETDSINSTFEKEAYILSTLRFPNIVAFYGIAITPSDRFIVIEYLSGGTLRKKIHDSKKKKVPLNVATKLNYLLDVAYGMKYLHSLDPPLIHRDLKPENILIADNNVAKICDFGLGREFTEGSTSILTSAIGTPVYMPPELILGQDYSEKCDTYSYGIIMWELLFEERAYSQESFEAMRDFMTKHKHLIDIKPYEPINLDEETNIDDVELEKEPLNTTSPLVKSNIDIEQIDSITMPNFNMISITTEIVNGLRPIIPFRTKKDFSFHQNSTTSGEHVSSSSRKYLQLDPLLKEYVKSVLMENEKGGIFGVSRNSEMKIALVVKEYCELMIRCWDKDVNRPSFAEICEKLSKCSSLLMN